MSSAVRFLVPLALSLLAAGGCRCAADAPAREAPPRPFVPSAGCPVPRPVVAGAGGFAFDDVDLDEHLDAVAGAFERTFDAGRFEEALACAQEAARLDPDSPAWHLDRGSALDALGQTHEAQAAYLRAVALDPYEPETLRVAGDFLLREASTDALETALVYARRGREHARDAALGAELAALEAAAANSLGRADEGLRAAETALALDGELGPARLERAVALFELLRLDEARPLFSALRREMPQSARAAFFAGLLAERDGRMQEAEAALAHAARLDPEGYPRGLDVPAAEFARLLGEEVRRLSQAERAALARARLSWEELPALSDLLAGDPVLSPMIVGLYRPAEGSGPDDIVVYRRNLLRVARDRDELRREIRDTLLHEIGHLEGQDDAELRDRGL